MLGPGMTFEKILVVESDSSIRKLLEQHLRKRRYLVSSVASLGPAEDLMKWEQFDLVFLDLSLTDGKGRDFLQHLTKAPSAPVVVVMSAFSEMSAAIRSVAAGAFDSIAKPFSLEEIDVIVSRAEAFGRLVEINRYMRRELRWDGELPGEVPAIRQLKSMVRKVAPTEATVLIFGERGVGKRLVGEAIHGASSRASGPLINVNCAAGSENEIDELLFGRDQGKAEPSRLELACGGTLILEDVGELTHCTQAKLLRVLQTRELERGGTRGAVKVDVRFIATHERNVVELVSEGGFLEELADWLNAFPLHVPALRDRLPDIPLLAEDWIGRLACRCGFRPAGISEEALRHLQAYCWPGNLRELENALGRAAILAGAGGRIEAAHFEFLQIRNAASANIKSGPALEAEEEPLLTLDELEKRQVLRALAYTNQNRTRAATLLKISVRTLRNKLHQYRADERTGSSGNLPLGPLRHGEASDGSGALVSPH